jgi:hypothetical protein
MEAGEADVKKDGLLSPSSNSFLEVTTDSRLLLGE